MNEVLNKGYITHIYGKNGAGKTTLLKKTCKYLMNHNISFSYVGHHHGLMETQTAADQIKFYRNLLGHDVGLWLEMIEDIDPNTFIYELSCGQKQRLSLACHLNFDNQVWLLDEPFDTLDSCASELLQSAFIRFLGDDKSIVLVDHSFDLKDNLHKYARDKAV